MAGEEELIGLIGTLGGELMSGMSTDQQKYLLEKAYAEFGKIDLPSLEKVIAEELGPSALEGVDSDPALKGIERSALDEMMRIGRSGGMTLEDKANLNAVQGSLGRQEAAGRNNIRENMARRGQRGGGAELAMSLANQQGSANRASSEGLNIAAQAQRRALDSILQGGKMAGGMRRDDFSEKTQRASAADARTRYNADARGRANAYNAGIGQQNFQNKIALAQGKSGQANNLSNFHGQQAADTRAAFRGAGQAGAGLMKAYGSDDEEEDDRWMEGVESNE